MSIDAPGPAPMRLALLVSAMAHALVVVLSRTSSPAIPDIASMPPSPPPSVEIDVDRWAGTTSLPGAGLGAVHDVGVERTTQPPAEEPPTSPRPATAEPKAAEPKAAEPRPAKPKVATPKAAEAPTTPPAASAADAPPARPTPRPSTEPRTTASAPASASAPPRSSAVAVRSGRKRSAPASSSQASAGPAGGDGGDFGADEERAGVRDLGRAFTRAIPPASDSDPAWAKLPPGDAGTITVEIAVDDGGKIVSFSPREREPPRHLVGLVKRTIAFMGSGTFAVRGQVGAGSEVLRLAAHVSDVEVPEDARTGGAFDLRHRFANGRGVASFTQVGGRRVDIEVEVLRR